MERGEEKLADLGVAVRAALASELSAFDDIRVARTGYLQKVATRNAQASTSQRGRLARHWRVWVLASATAAGAMALWAWSRVPVAFHIDAAATPGQPGDLVRAAPEKAAQLRFSDGSSVELTAGGRLRVLATHARGARVLVEDGAVDVHIPPSRLGKKQWSFEAGAFHVKVAGTRFYLSYQAADQSLALATHEGQVLVSGPCMQGETAVAAGARLDAACVAKNPAPTRTASLSTVPAGPPERNEAQTSPPRAPRDTSAWRELLLAGRLQDGLRAAERADFNRVCQVATAKELLALADAARLFGRSSRATAALRVLRQRFPKSTEAATAAFTLGRVAFEQQRAYAEAATWFATYLREQPNGPLMGDAVGRLMEAKLRAGDDTGARADAEQYLRRFPEGPYASEARGILSK